MLGRTGWSFESSVLNQNILIINSKKGLIQLLVQVQFFHTLQTLNLLKLSISFLGINSNMIQGGKGLSGMKSPPAQRDDYNMSESLLSINSGTSRIWLPSEQSQ